MKIATPDPWKAGSRAAAVKGPRRLNENKLLTAKKGRYNPYSKAFRKCRICGQSVHQPEAHYCQSCAFKKGICAMCGVRLVNTTNYNQCAVWEILLLILSLFSPPSVCTRPPFWYLAVPITDLLCKIDSPTTAYMYSIVVHALEFGSETSVQRKDEKTVLHEGISTTLSTALWAIDESCRIGSSLFSSFDVSWLPGIKRK